MQCQTCEKAAAVLIDHVENRQDNAANSAAVDFTCPHMVCHENFCTHVTCFLLIDKQGLISSMQRLINSAPC